MIFETHPHPHQAAGRGVIVVPLFDTDAYDMLEVMDKAFPPNYDTPTGRSIGLCCWGGYENALEFV